MRQRAIGVFFAVWIVGVQVAELLALIGVVGLALAVLSEGLMPNAIQAAKAADAVPSRFALALEWKLLVAFLAASLLLPLLGGHAPSGTGAARIFSLAAIPLAAAATARLTPMQLRGALIAAAITLTVSCVLAGLQHFGLWPAAERMELLAKLKIPTTRVYEEVPGAPGRFMGGGLLFHRLKFAHVSSFAVLACAAVAIRTTGRTRQLSLAASVVGLVSILWFPFARAAALALVIGLVTLLLLSARSLMSPRARMTLIAASGGVLVAFTLVLALNDPFRARLFRSNSEDGSGGRRQLVAAGFAALRAHPLTGVGLGRYLAKDWLEPGAAIYLVEQKGKAHNQLLSVAVETGIVSALIFTAFLLALARRLWTSPLGASGLAALVYFAALGAVHDPLFHAEFGLALAAALGAPSGLRPAANVATEVHPVKRDA